MDKIHRNPLGEETNQVPDIFQFEEPIKKPELNVSSLDTPKNRKEIE